MSFRLLRSRSALAQYFLAESRDEGPVTIGCDFCGAYLKGVSHEWVTDCEDDSEYIGASIFDDFDKADQVAYSKGWKVRNGKIACRVCVANTSLWRFPGELIQ